MARKIVNVGASANDGTGDPLRTAFIKINENFEALYPAVGIMVVTTNDPVQNGTNLKAAYAEAKISTPYGQALSAVNRASVIVPPGVYDFGSTPLTLDTQYVDLIGLSAERSVQYIKGTPPYLNSGVIVQTANDVHISNLTVEILTTSEEPDMSASVSAAYFPSTNLDKTVIKNCNFIGSVDGEDGQAFAMRYGIEYSGYFEKVKASAYSFGAGGTASGEFRFCESTDVCAFGGEGVASGKFISCVGGEGAFGGFGTASGYFVDCTATDFGFGGGGSGASGTFIRCIGNSSCWGTLASTGRTYFCMQKSTVNTPAAGGKHFAYSSANTFSATIP